MLIETYKKQIGTMLDGYEPKGIYHSELCRFCEDVVIHACDNIVESGTYLGYTAIRLAKMFPKMTIITFEIDKVRHQAAKYRCFVYKNIECRLGELRKSMSVINDKTAVLVDGPKGLEAIKLARKALKRGCFVSLHDMRDYLNVLKTKFPQVSDTGGMGDEYRLLDSAIPYKPTHHEKGLYGKVLATVQ